MDIFVRRDSVHWNKADDLDRLMHDGFLPGAWSWGSAQCVESEPGWNIQYRQPLRYWTKPDVSNGFVEAHEPFLSVHFNAQTVVPLIQASRIPVSDFYAGFLPAMDAFCLASKDAQLWRCPVIFWLARSFVLARRCTATPEFVPELREVLRPDPFGAILLLVDSCLTSPSLLMDGVT